MDCTRAVHIFRLFLLMTMTQYIFGLIVIGLVFLVDYIIVKHTYKNNKNDK